MRRTLIFALILATGNVIAQSARLRGRVMDASGSVMPGAQVKLYRAEEVIKEGLTSATGDFDFAAGFDSRKEQRGAGDGGGFV